MVEFAQRERRLIAIAGKGGTGKTVLTALMTKILVSSGKAKILVIDADPAMGLSNILGVRVGKTLEDVRNEIIKVASTGKREEKTQMVMMLDYKIFEALVEKRGFALLAMGQPKAPGCFCPANTLLKSAVQSLSKSFDIVLVDCEAGLEQISRKVVSDVGTLAITTDVTMRGVQTAVAIKKAAHKFTKAKRVGLVVNRVKDGEKSIQNLTLEAGMEIFGWIPEDNHITEWDFVGRPILDLPETSPSVIATRQIMENMHLAI